MAVLSIAAPVGPGFVTGKVDRASQPAPGRTALIGLNLFMAHMQAGIGRGAALGPALGGWLSACLGNTAIFECRGALALIAIMLWVGFSRTVMPSCARPAPA